MRRRKTSRIPVTNIAGVGGQPGIYPSPEMTASTAPTTAWLPAKMPPLHPQAPTATTSLGDGTASYAVKTAYEAVPSPKLVVAVGACGCSGGIFAGSHAVVGAVDAVISGDGYIPGCPPTPAMLVTGILEVLRRRIAK